MEKRRKGVKGGMKEGSEGGKKGGKKRGRRPITILLYPVHPDVF